MSWLIVGIEGFVGSHMRTLLNNKGYKVVGTSWEKERVNNTDTFFVDLYDPESIKKVVTDVKPDFLVLLAGFSSMRESFANPEGCMRTNFESTRDFLQAIKDNNLNTKVLTVSSAMVYCPSTTILTENSPICSNTSPYAESKYKQEQLIKEFPEIKIIATRSFNHTGPNQLASFLIPKLVNAFKVPEKEITIKMGDTSSERDFLDVRDVCEAYRLLLEEDTNHKIYNVSSSKYLSIKQILEILEKETGKKVIIQDNPEFRGKNERPRIWGSNKLICEDTSWEPTIPFEKTIKDMLQQ